MPGMQNTMDEFKHGELHSGSKSGPIVRKRKQAIAIGLSEQRKAKGGKGKKRRAKRPVGHSPAIAAAMGGSY